MSYKSETQNKNLAWFLPRPKKDHYKGGMPLYCEEWLIELGQDILNNHNPKILNLFCGMNKFGLRIDINPEVKPDILADAHNLDAVLDHQTFDIILADPPYSTEESKELYGTGKLNYAIWTKQATKHLNPNGLLIVYHKYLMPNPDPDKFVVAKRVFIANRVYHLPRIATYFQLKLGSLRAEVKT